MADVTVTVCGSLKGDEDPTIASDPVLRSHLVDYISDVNANKEVTSNDITMYTVYNGIQYIINYTKGAVVAPLPIEPPPVPVGPPGAASTVPTAAPLTLGA